MPGERECGSCNLLRLALTEAMQAVKVSRADPERTTLARFRCPTGEGYHVAPPARRDELTGRVPRMTVCRVCLHPMSDHTDGGICCARGLTGTGCRCIDGDPMEPIDTTAIYVKLLDARDLRSAVAAHQRAVAIAWPIGHPTRIRCETLADLLDPPLWVHDITEPRTVR